LSDTTLPEIEHTPASLAASIEKLTGSPEPLVAATV
jgi:hypothetical protein